MMDAALHRAREDVAALCRDRPMPTHEIAAVNTFYGHDQVLKHYAGLPADQPLPAVIPHSPVPHPYYVWHGESRPPVPAVLAYPAFRQRAFEWATNKLVVPAASPYAHVLRLSGPRGEYAGPDRVGTIFFPQHSTHHITVEEAWEQLADVLASVGEPYAPVTVCMYWRDVQLSRDAAFWQRGLQVVSAGHIFDPDFLFRFRTLCATHRYAAGSQFGTHVPLSAASGCIYTELPGLGTTPRGPFEGVGTESTTEPDVLRLPAELVRLDGLADLRSVFFTNSPDPERQRRAADWFLGADHVGSPGELRALIDHLWRLDRRQFRVPRPGGRHAYVVPPFVRRPVVRAREKLAFRTRLKQLAGKLRSPGFRSRR